MSAESLKMSFTDDEEIGEWIVGDTSVELKGYVDCIEGTKMVTPSKDSSGKSVPLYKILINNGSKKRVRAIFWGNLASKYSPLIHDRTIVEIIRAKVTAGNVTFNNPHQNIDRLELYIMKSTEIIIYNEKYGETVEPKEIPNIPMMYLKDLEATVFVNGYIKQEFSLIESYNSSYGGGIVADGVTRLPVRIINFDQSKKFPKGTYIQLLGKAFTPLNGPPQLVVDSSKDITVCSDVAVLTAEELRGLGRRPPTKRKADIAFDEMN